MHKNGANRRARSLQAERLLEPLPVPAFLWDLDSQSFVGSNQGFRDLIGYSEKEVLELDWRDLLIPEEITTGERAIEAGPEMKAVRWHFRRKDDQVLSVTLSSRGMLFIADDGTISKTYIALVISVGDEPAVSANAAFPEN